MSTHPLHTDHARLFEHNRFVYPVLSRRSGGISIGVNLNPDKICNFDCIYCQVDRRSQSETRFVETAALIDELRTTLDLVISRPHLRHAQIRRRAAATSAASTTSPSPATANRRPTKTSTRSSKPAAANAMQKRRVRSAECRVRSLLRPRPFRLPPSRWSSSPTPACSTARTSQRGLAILDENNGEIWAKLEAGTDEYYHLIERTPIPFRQILDNITAAARVRPIVIQSLFMRVAGEPPSPAELEAFCDRLNEITAAGGKLKLVQIYTVARRPAESYVAPLSDEEVDAIVAMVKNRAKLHAVGYYGNTNV